MRISSSVALGRGIKRLFLAVRQGKDEKCWDAETNNYVAVKVIKNQPAFYQQAIMEVSLLSLVRYFNVHSSIYFCWMHGKI